MENEDDDDEIYDEIDDEEEEYLFGADEDDSEDYEEDDESEDYEEELVAEDESEDYDDEDEENPEDSYDFSEEDELEPQSHCMTCGVDEIKATDRWNFKMIREDGTEEPAWICRTCHSQFDSIESFNKFMANEQYRRLYMKASTLMRLLALDVPLGIVAKTLFSGMPSVLFWTDEHDGSEEARRLAREELEKVAEKYLGNRKD